MSLPFPIPNIIAHRGASATCPENTIAAFKEAAALGIEWVEFDVQLTQDQIPVVIHDKTLNRTTDGEGNVLATTYDDIELLDAGSWFAAEFSDEKVPSLARTLIECAELDLGINVEIKPVEGYEEETVTRTLEMLAKHWPESLPLIVSSFDEAVLAAVHACNSDILLGYLTREWTARSLTIIDEYQCATVHVAKQLVTEELVQIVKDKQLPLLAYTVDELDVAEHLWSLGVDSVFSNNPAIMLM